MPKEEICIHGFFLLIISNSNTPDPLKSGLGLLITKKDILFFGLIRINNNNKIVLDHGILYDSGSYYFGEFNTDFELPQYELIKGEEIQINQNKKYSINKVDRRLKFEKMKGPQPMKPKFIKEEKLGFKIIKLINKKADYNNNNDNKEDLYISTKGSDNYINNKMTECKIYFIKERVYIIFEKNSENSILIINHDDPDNFYPHSEIRYEGYLIKFENESEKKLRLLKDYTFGNIEKDVDGFRKICYNILNVELTNCKIYFHPLDKNYEVKEGNFFYEFDANNGKVIQKYRKKRKNIYENDFIKIAKIKDILPNLYTSKIGMGFEGGPTKLGDLNENEGCYSCVCLIF